MIMIVEPFQRTWSATCTLCDRVLRNSYRSKWDARRAAASHLWAHRSDHPPRPNSRHAARTAKLDREQQLAELMRDRAPCPTPSKRRHISEAEARDHIQMLERAGRGNPDYSAYRCQCGCYHVGHSKLKFESRIKKALRKGR